MHERYTLVLIFSFIFTGSLLLRVASSNETPPQNAVQTSTTTSRSLKNSVEAIARQERFTKLPIEAKAVYVWDATDNIVLYQKESEVPLPLASVTKLLLAWTALSKTEFNSIVTITSEDVAEEGNSGLGVGEKFNLESLLRATLVASSNDAATAIARHIGQIVGGRSDEATAKRRTAELMNKEAKNMGLLQTTAFNEDGLDVSTAFSGAYGSARDMARLMERLITKYPNIMRDTAQPQATVSSQQNVTHIYANTNPIIEKLPGLIGSKTGFTNNAGGNLVIAGKHAEHIIIVAVLGSTRGERFQDVEMLYRLAGEEVDKQHP